MDDTLAFSPTYANTRRNLAPNFFVANPSAAFARLLTNASFSVYNSLQLELRRRFSRGLSWQASYTLSKTITDSEGGQSNLESYRTLRNPALDRHLASFDQRHRFIANAIYELPFGPVKNWLHQGGVLGKIAGGWQVASIFNWQSGVPFGLFSGRTTFNSFNSGLNPAELTGISFEDFQKNIGVFRTSGGIFFINPNLLDVQTNSSGQVVSSSLKNGLVDSAPLGGFGNFPRNVLRGPRFFQTDFTIIKRTAFMEGKNVELKVTFLNAFNNANFVHGSFNFDSTSFGQITGTTGTPRVIHFELGINF